jgi:putative phosphoesterase
MVIAILADTHNRLPDSVVERISHVDEIWHLGDVCLPSMLDSLYALRKPLHVVRGNNDFHEDWPITLDLQRQNFSFHLVHMPPHRLDPSKLFVLHGHTHVPRNEKIGETTFLNPGAITRANRGAPASFAFLTIKAKGEIDWKIELV